MTVLGDNWGFILYLLCIFSEKVAIAMAYQIGKCLLSERLRYVGMTQSQLAEQLGVTRQQVHKWATEKQRMSIETAKNVSTILDLNKIDDLYEWKPTRN